MRRIKQISPAIFFSVFLFLSFQLFSQKIITGAERTTSYLPLLKNKKVALVVNHSSVIGNMHLVDSLLNAGIKITKIFAPEHGFRGDHADGSEIKSGTDSKTGLAIVSLYGKNKKPTQEQMADIDIVLFDIQDVGARFYTYLSTLHYVMEACAENNIKLVVLDRPNPNGFYVDGPVLDTACCTSFVGMHPVPIMYGMTIGEYACMINGEKWLANGVKCNLDIVELKNYTHDSLYQLPVWPSPNLNSMESIYLYPSLCLFEGTDVSVGRGTALPFTVIGSPNLKFGDHYFTPKSIPGKSDNPPHLNAQCRGLNLYLDGKNIPLLKEGIIIEWLIIAYGAHNNPSKFFTTYFEKLCGNNLLRQQIIEKKPEKEIKDSWKAELDDFKKIRKKYLLYP